MSSVVRLKKNSKKKWESENEVLPYGELAIEIDDITGNARFKLGDGVTPWRSLDYTLGGLSEEQIVEVVDRNYSLGERQQELHSSRPKVSELMSVNYWGVDGTQPYQIELPEGIKPGSSFLVFVEYGFQKIIWPNGTTTVGSTIEDYSWITLIKENLGWTVLIPSPSGGGGGLDSGWHAWLNRFSSNPPLGVGWSIGFGINIRRTDNVLWLAFQGVEATGDTGGRLIVTLPTGIRVFDSTNASLSTMGYHHDVITDALTPEPLVVHSGPTPGENSKIYLGRPYEKGIRLGRQGTNATPTNPSGRCLVSFPISPASTWWSM